MIVRLIMAARYLGISPWELAEQSTAWMDWALEIMFAEQYAEIERNRPREKM